MWFKIEQINLKLKYLRKNCSLYCWWAWSYYFCKLVILDSKFDTFDCNVSKLPPTESLTYYSGIIKGERNGKLTCSRSTFNVFICLERLSWPSDTVATVLVNCAAKEKEWSSNPLCFSYHVHVNLSAYVVYQPKRISDHVTIMWLILTKSGTKLISGVTDDIISRASDTLKIIRIDSLSYFLCTLVFWSDSSLISLALSWSCFIVTVSSCNWALIHDMWETSRRDTLACKASTAP